MKNITLCGAKWVRKIIEMQLDGQNAGNFTPYLTANDFVNFFEPGSNNPISGETNPFIYVADATELTTNFYCEKEKISLYLHFSNREKAILKNATLDFDEDKHHFLFLNEEGERLKILSR